MKDNKSIVVTIDGPSGSGKGSLAIQVARKLDLHLLDSGAIYRLLALKAIEQGTDLDNAEQLVSLLEDFNIWKASISFSLPDEFIIYFDFKNPSHSWQ